MASAREEDGPRPRSNTTGRLADRRQRRRVPSIKDLKRSFSSLRRGSNTPRLQNVVFLGDLEVGKTCLISRMMHDYFTTEYEPTMELVHDFRMNLRGLEEMVVIVDTTGDPNEEVKNLRRAAIGRGNAFVVVYNVKKRRSFLRASKFLEEIMEVSNDEGRELSRSDIGSARRVLLVGNQADEDDNDDGYDSTAVKASAPREVESSDAWDLADLFGIKNYLEMSAMTGLGVDSIQMRLASLYQSRRSDDKAGASSSSGQGTLLRKVTSFLHRDGGDANGGAATKPPSKQTSKARLSADESTIARTSSFSERPTGEPVAPLKKKSLSFRFKFGRNRKTRKRNRSSAEAPGGADEPVSSTDVTQTETEKKKAKDPYTVYHVAL